MDEQKLHYIDPPDSSRTAAQVAAEVLHLLHSEYIYSTSDLCNWFLCDRQWVEKVIRPKVRHILLTYYFRQYILSLPSLSGQDRNLISKGFYFYSKQDLQQFWIENAKAERKMKMIDLAPHRKHCTVFELRNEIEFHRSAKPCKAEKARHEGRMRKLLDEKGYAIYEGSLKMGKEWYGVKLPALEANLKFTTLADTREREKLHSGSVAMQHLLKAGGIRVKLGSRALWILPDTSSLLVPISVNAGFDLS